NCVLLTWVTEELHFEWVLKISIGVTSRSEDFSCLFRWMVTVTEITGSTLTRLLLHSCVVTSEGFEEFRQ
ncbi:hypothetical protein S245_005687, partial [Arachis hypogaea]